jgi:glycosyltransferase involved in cell wall biosynthesis
LKILHLIPAIAARYGGPSQAIRSLCRHLQRKENCQVELATTDSDGLGRSLPQSEIPCDFPVHVFRRNWSERWKYSAGLATWLNAHVGDFDLIHIHSVWNHACYAGVRAAIAADVPFVIRPAGMFSGYSLSHRGLTKRISWILSERRAVQKVAAFHATTAGEAEDICRVAPWVRSFVIPNGVDDEAFFVPESPDEWRKDWFRDTPDRPVLLFLSRLHPKKGIVDLLLPALASMSVRPLTILAGGRDDHDPGYADQVQRTITALNLESDVRLLGQVTGSRRWTLFDAADAFILPSHSENFGIVVAEAMARGCPPIVTEAVQIGEQLRDHNCGVVVKPDPAIIAEAIRSLCEAVGRRQQLGVNARNYCEQNFSWAGVAEQVLKMYQSVLTAKNQKTIRNC